MLAEGIGIGRDHQAALHWCRPLAEQGHAAAQLLLYRLYREGKGVPKDPVEAMKWLIVATVQGQTELIELVSSNTMDSPEAWTEAKARAKAFLVNLQPKNRQ